MTQVQDTDGKLGWLLDNLVSRVASISQALVLSRDGLVVARSRSMSQDQGDTLSALAAGVYSLARGAGQQVGAGEVRQTIIEMDSAFMFVMAAGHGTCLAVLASQGANLGVMAYEMTRLVRQMGMHLTASPRAPEHPAAR